ncbi:hypothetical protein K502DRAFT_58489 [Neoconidiobolus thromboides FSU 785]|nr:hypothetical protein K502DRAFT_58489 [Neoconidiobolus thromboides FSU 785]
MTSKLANNLSRSASINIRSSKYESDTPITHIRSNSNPQTLWNTPSKRPATVVITGQSQDCFVCHLPVYPAEQCLVDSYSLHPNCFRCRHCNQLLSLSTNEKLDGKLILINFYYLLMFINSLFYLLFYLAYFYCKAHYKLYTHNNELIRSNPLLANASYSQSISLAVEVT